MAGFDMPACDAARHGGPAGWKLRTETCWFETKVGVAIEGWPEGNLRRKAVLAPQGHIDVSGAIARCIPVLNEWVSRKGWERHGIR